MTAINERIAYVVEHCCNGVKRTFAKELNVSPTYISQLCMGQREPSDRTVKDICRLYSVNENWLRTGEGEMFTERSRQQEIEKFLSDLANGSDFKRRLVLLMAQMTEDEWALMERMLRKISEEI